eukprot:COSAG02_NODE_602_length_19711_cov_20.882674_9_plen_75_part_00
MSGLTRESSDSEQTWPTYLRPSTTFFQKNHFVLKNTSKRNRLKKFGKATNYTYDNDEGEKWEDEFTGTDALGSH